MHSEEQDVLVIRTGLQAGTTMLGGNASGNVGMTNAYESHNVSRANPPLPTPSWRSVSEYVPPQPAGGLGGEP